MKIKLIIILMLISLENFARADYLNCTTITPANKVLCQARALIYTHMADVNNAIISSPTAPGVPNGLRESVASQFELAYPLAINTSISFTGTPGIPSSYQTYVITGAYDCLGPPNQESSINPPGTMSDMWIRDAAAQLHSYLGIYQDQQHVYPQDEESALSAIMIGFVHTAAIDISESPTAHAFDINDNVPQVGVSYEMDSNAFFIWFAYDFWKATGETAQFDSNFVAAARNIITLVGSNINSNINLSSTQFRASDDPAQYPYNIPDNMFMVTALNDLAQIFNDQSLSIYNPSYANVATSIASQIQQGIEKHGVTIVNGTTIYAYETDGVNYLTIDDANLPSLLSAPYLGYSGNSGTMRNTRGFILNFIDNPYYFISGSQQYGPMPYQGMGSYHTEMDVTSGIWPLALVAQGITESSTNSSSNQQNILEQIYTSAQFNPNSDMCDSDRSNYKLYPAIGYLHETFSAINPLWGGTRGWFTWPNAFYGEWIDQMVLHSTAQPLPWSV